MSVIAAVALALAGCGGGDDDDAAPTVSATQTTPTETTTPAETQATETSPPAASGVPVTKRALVGELVRSGQIIYVRFQRNGRFAMDQLSLDEPDIGGRYELEGGTVRFANEIEGPCASGTGWAWDARIVDDELHATFSEGGCAVPTGEMWILVRRLAP